MYSKESYKSILRLALDEGYRFASFQEVSGRKIIYLRHDVDFSIDMALKLSELNASLGVQGTFFLLVRSQIYNLLSNYSLKMVEEMEKLGQRIALHFTPPVAKQDDQQIAFLIKKEFDLIRSQIPNIEPVFSWHNPGHSSLSTLSSLQIHGLVNTYDSYFLRDVGYFSDSNMRHTAEEFKDVVSRGMPKLHLLFHPLNWVIGGANMKDILAVTWRSVVREREVEFLNNNTYKQLLPEGMPDIVLDAFEKQWRIAADQDYRK